MALDFNPPVPLTVRGVEEPPLLRYADSGSGSAPVPVPGKKGGQGPNDMRGYLVQAIDFPVDWQTEAGFSVGSKKVKKGKPINDAKTRYGFQFHFNPTQIQFQTALTQQIDISIAAAGLDKFKPLSPLESPAMIGINITLSRVDDMNLLKAGGVLNENLNGYDPYPKASVDKRRMIYERGTGADLEYLYRCTVGRPYKTTLRGETADIGLMYAVPQYLVLNDGMKYLGRVTGLQYTHLQFVRNLVPTLTTVSISFERFPDADGQDIVSKQKGPR